MRHDWSFDGVDRTEIESWTAAHCPDGWSWPRPGQSPKGVLLAMLAELDRLAALVEDVREDASLDRESARQVASRLLDADTEINRLRTAGATRDAALAAMRERFPCDQGCRDYPEEVCSQHGRPPAEIWQIVEACAAQRNAAELERDALAAELDKDRHEYDGDGICRLRSLPNVGICGVRAEATTHRTSRVVLAELTEAER